MKEELEIPKICTMFRPEPVDHCTCLEDQYYRKYKLLGHCGTSKCPFFKPGGPGDGQKIVRKERKDGRVYFEPFERKEYDYD